uniref:Uncharacterized protein n=1 Tax=Strigamia maritima TaxID=126957 RepID=T1JJ36_STRMM
MLSPFYTRWQHTIINWLANLVAILHFSCMNPVEQQDEIEIPIPLHATYAPGADEETLEMLKMFSEVFAEIVMFASTFILVHISFQVWAYAGNKSTSSTSETSSTDLSSQSSHTRTLGDFFPSLKSVKRSKSLPNSAAKFESPRGKSCKSVPSALKPADINEWPSPNASSSGKKSVTNPYVFESALNKPKSFAEIIKTKPTEQKTNTMHFDTNSMSAEEFTCKLQ